LPEPADLPEAVALVEEWKPPVADVATVDVASPYGRVHSWYLLGGIGIWQVILSARGRRGRQPEKISA
jgi:hypothetical protein